MLVNKKDRYNFFNDYIYTKVIRSLVTKAIFISCKLMFNCGLTCIFCRLMATFLVHIFVAFLFTFLLDTVNRFYLTKCGNML